MKRKCPWCKAERVVESDGITCCGKHFKWNEVGLVKYVYSLVPPQAHHPLKNKITYEAVEWE